MLHALFACWQEMTQYLVLDSDVEVEEHEETLKRLFTAAEAESGSEDETSSSSASSSGSSSSANKKPKTSKKDMPAKKDLPLHV